MNARLAVSLLFALSLAGCMETFKGGSIENGESKVFERPPYVVKGKRPYDQSWIDSQIEGGVSAFHWKRPAPRPASLDAPPSPKQVKAKAAKRPGLVKRIKARVWPTNAPAVIATPVAPEWSDTQPPQPAAPRDPVDELLDGK
jgi:hypothetical protein